MHRLRSDPGPADVEQAWRGRSYDPEMRAARRGRVGRMLDALLIILLFWA
jgi:hypothetical protein